MYHFYIHLNLHFLYLPESFMITISLHIHIILTIISNKILCISILVSFYLNIYIIFQLFIQINNIYMYFKLNIPL